MLLQREPQRRHFCLRYTATESDSALIFIHDSERERKEWMQSISFNIDDMLQRGHKRVRLASIIELRTLGMALVKHEHS